MLTLCLERQQLSNEKGFSLLEVIVAIALLGLGIVAIMQLFSTGLDSARKTDEYTRALIHARSLMDDAMTMDDLARISDSGDFNDGFSYQRSAKLKESREKTDVYEVDVEVFWGNGGVVRLKSLKTVEHER